MLLNQLYKPIQREASRGESAVGMYNSCMKPDAWWEDGRCVGENNNDLVGELKGNDVTQNECAILCSEELKITACEYDKVKQSCTAHTQIVTSGSSSSPNKHYDDVNKQCSIILA